MKTLIPALLCLLSSVSYSQQRLGFEVSSRLEDLSFTTNFMKVVDDGFIVGAGLMIQGRYLGYGEATNDQLHNPFSFVPDTIRENGNTYSLKDYGSHSGMAFCLQGLIGYFHEFSDFHGLRFNLSIRGGVAKTEVYAKYHSFTDSKYNYKMYQGWTPYTAVCPEIYHTLRQSNKWTFYYGVRYPFYFNFEPYTPHYSTDIYHDSRIEVAIGLTRSIGKCETE